MGPVRSIEADSTVRQTKTFGQSECQHRHFTLDSLPPRMSSLLGNECPPEGQVTPETLTPQSSQASAARTTPCSLTPPLEVSLEDPFPPHASSSIGNRFPPVSFKPPPGLPAPPGLDMPSLAGLPQDMPRKAQNTSVDQVSAVPNVSKSTPNSTREICVSEHIANGLNVLSRVVDGAVCTQVGWRIRDPLRKFRATCGYPIVSPEFAIDGGRSLRLQFVAGQKWEAECSKSNTKRRNNPTKADQLPLYGAIQLKTLGDFSLKDSARQASCSLGGVQQGQLDLAERTVQGVDLVTDWRTHLEGDDGRDIVICIDFIRA